MSLDNPDTKFNVVVNIEEQYSIWPEYKDIPAGWNKVGKEGQICALKAFRTQWLINKLKTG